MFDGMVKRRNVTGGVFDIKPLEMSELEVYCDVETDGGGWTVSHLISSLSFRETKLSVYERRVLVDRENFNNKMLIKRHPCISQFDSPLDYDFYPELTQKVSGNQ